MSSKQGIRISLGLLAILGVIAIGEVEAQGITRLAFTRPGGMMRVPTSSVTKSDNLFTAGFVSELLNISPYNQASGVYFDAEISKNLRLGLSTVSTADTSANLETSTYKPPLQIGFHLQQRIWSYGNISFSLGLQDIVLTQTEGTFTVNPDLLSFIGVISSEQTIGGYQLNSYMGFGTGAIGGATGEEADTAGSSLPGASTATTPELRLGVYAGFMIQTPIMAKRGGLQVIGEFDGTGINAGISIPLTSDYRLQLGAVHVESLPQFGAQSDLQRLEPDAPSIVIGLNLSVPRILEPVELRALDALGPRPLSGADDVPPEALLPSQIDSAMKSAEFLITSLRDSLRINRFEAKNLLTQLAQRDQEGIVLADSVRNMLLRYEMLKSNLNTTMRHFTLSWQYYIQENYRDALQEVEMAIQLNPDLAIAYARRGSIYYKLGDTQRATINWNLALTLDPEYDDVRNILRALKENRLSATSLTRQ